MDIRLVKASEDDLQIILNILNDGTRNKVRRGDLAWGMSDHNPEAVREMVTNGLFYLALSGTAPVGVFALAWQDDHMWGKQPANAGYVQRFAVAAGYSGQNLGGQIIDLALKEVQQHGRQYLRFAVPSGNEKLRTYYENHGFIRADNKIISPIHPTYPAAYYEHSIDGSFQTLNRKKTGLFAKLRSSKLFRESE